MTGIRAIGRMGRYTVRAASPPKTEGLRNDPRHRQFRNQRPQTNNQPPQQRTAVQVTPNRSVSVNLFRDPAFRELGAALNQIQTVKDQSVRLMSKTPVTTTDIQNVRAQLDQQRTELSQLRSKVELEFAKLNSDHADAPELTLALEAEKQLSELIVSCVDRAAILEKRQNSTPSSVFHQRQALQKQYQAAIKLLSRNLPESVANKDPRSQLLAQLQQEETELQQQLSHASKGAPCSAAEVRQLKILPKRLVERIGISGVNVRESDLKHVQAQQSNDQHWDKSVNPVHFSYHGQYHRFTETSTPASKLALPVAALPEAQQGVEVSEGIFAKPYPSEGISCHCATETDHATNLHTVQLADEKGDTVFQAVRHGVMSPYGYKPGSQERTDGALHRAEEAALSALQLHPDKLESALNDQEVELILTSSSLLTPDFFRHKAGNAEKDEQAMLTDQANALNQLSRRGTIPVKLPSGDIKQLKVKLQVVPLNFGLNKFSLGATAGVTGGWGPSDRLNKDGLKKLIGLDVGLNPESVTGKRLAELQAQKPPHPDIPLIEELTHQIRQLYHQNQHHNTVGGAAKLASRVMVLTHLLGGTPLVNCKSGKDRTALALTDAEWLVTRMRLTGKVPEPTTVSPMDEQLFMEFALQGSHLKIQELNSGAPGFKLDPMVLASYISDPEALAYLRGLGDAVPA